ncbi:MAG: glycoside hydrolase family 88 protein [Bacteroidota bacterium]
MKKVTMLFTCLFILLLHVTAQPGADSVRDEEVLRRVADKIIRETIYEFEGTHNKQTYTSAKDVPDTATVRIKSGYAGWGYPNGVLNMAMLNLSAFLSDTKYADHPKKQLAFVFDNYKVFEQRYTKAASANPAAMTVQATRRFPFSSHFVMRELDDCGAMGASLLDVYQTVKRDDYLAYINKAANHITTIQDRFEDGTLSRKVPHQLTLWADDLYMSVPFLTRMARLTGDQKYFDDAIKQVLNFTKYLWDPNKQLYYHCYFNDVKQNGVAYWGRCNGWIMVAQVHLLNLLPQNHPQRKAILANLERQIIGIAKYQGPNGLWYQLLDKSDSYPESSCTAMFTYSIARAVNQGWIDRRYASIATRGWNALKTKEITPEGYMKDVCVGTGISSDLVFYYTRPVGKNDPHGLGAFLDAGIEVMKYKKANAQR